MKRNPFEIDGPYRREPRIYRFVNWLCGVILCGLVWLSGRGR